MSKFIIFTVLGNTAEVTTASRPLYLTTKLPMSDKSDIWQGQFAGNFPQNDILNIAISLSQSQVTAFQSWNLHR